MEYRAEFMMVFAFDRDRTVRVNQLYKPDTLVPLAWVRHLAQDTEHEVWAIGNQTLKSEADILGIEELAERYYEAGIDRLGEKDDWGHYEYWPIRRERLRMLSELFPNATEHIVVDDIDLSDVEDWDHYHAWEFVPAVEQGEIAIDLPTGTE